MVFLAGDYGATSELVSLPRPKDLFTHQGVSNGAVDQASLSLLPLGGKTTSDIESENGESDSVPNSRIVSPGSSQGTSVAAGGGVPTGQDSCPRRPKRSLMSVLSFDTSGSNISPRTARQSGSSSSPCTETFSLRRLSTVSSQRIRSSFSRGLFRRKSSSHSMSEQINKNREKKLAYVSLYIVWLFIFCHVWKLIPTGYEILMSKDEVGMEIDDWPGWVEIIEQVSHTLITLNSSLNFFVYLVL